jgi:pyruvate dehydrogenase E1 component alpha subunit
VDGNDIESAHAAALEAAHHVRSGKGPFFLELTTYRWREHCGPNFDNDIGYRTEKEFQDWRSRDPIAVHERMMLGRGDLSQSALEALHTQIDAEVASAFEFAESSPFPDQAEAFSDEYVVAGVSA